MSDEGQEPEKDGGRRSLPSRAAKKTVDLGPTVKLVATDEALDGLASLLLDSAEFRAELLERIGEWMKDHADRKTALALLKGLPQRIIQELPMDTSAFRYARECCQLMIDDARKNLDLQNEELLLSSFLEDTWTAASCAAVVDECATRDIGDELDSSDRIRQVCLAEREDILNAMTLVCFKSFAARIDVKVKTQSWRAVAKVVKVLTERKPGLVAPTPTPTPIPTLGYLERLHGDFEAQKLEMARLGKMQENGSTGTCVVVLCVP